MSKNQNKSASGSGNTRGDVSFIRATSSSSQSVTSNTHSNQQKSFDNIPIQHFDMNSSHLPHQSQSSQEISHHAFHPVQDIPHHSHSLHHYQRSKQQHQPIEQYHPDLPDHNPFLLPGGSDGMNIPSHTGVETWGTKEEALAAELEEAKIRVAQMEKTMRWWSDCTSNWREKWNKARNERNKAREENRILRIKLESVSKDLSRLKREKRELVEDKESKKVEDKVSKSSSCKSQENLSELSEKEKHVLAKANEKETESTDELSEASSPKLSSAYREKDVDDIAGDTIGQECPSTTIQLESKATERVVQLEEALVQSQEKFAQALENVLVMQRKLDEASNTIQGERLENCNQAKVIQNLKRELGELQSALDEALKVKLNLRKERNSEDVGDEDESEVSVAELDSDREKHREELNRLSLDLEDESHSRSSMDRHVSDLRRELERLQTENACEWGKRERLESEKLLLERDNKKLHTQVKDLEEEVDRRSQASTFSANSDIKTLQFELAERSKEASELKHVNSKFKKVLNDRGTELDHNKRRAEQYEVEVRKLRGRIDELKHDLATAEDEVDSQTNAVRKAQRANDELQEHVDSLQVQVNHLQSRLRRNANLKHGAGGAPRSSSMKSFSMEDSAELADSENDFDDV